MNKFIGKVVCFFKGHDEWDGGAAVAISHKKLGTAFVSIEYCTRCMTLWGKPTDKLANKLSDFISQQLAPTQTKLEMPPVPNDIDQDFVVDEAADTLMRVKVRWDSKLTDTDIEVVCENGKIVAYNLDIIPKPSYTAADVEEIREQIGSILSKIDDPRKIVVSTSVFEIFNFDFGRGLMKWTILNSNGNGIVTTNTQSQHTKGTVCDQSQNGNGVSGFSSSH